MPSVRVIDESGEMRTLEVTTGGMTLELDNGEEFSPAVVDRLEFDHEGVMSQITWKACNRVENRREADKKPDIVCEGIVTENQLKNLKLLDGQSDLVLTSDLHSGPVAVRRVIIEQTADLVEFVPDSGEPQLAFAFQVQMKVSQYEDSVTTVPMDNTVFAETADAVLEE